jgi:hypothetical protein
MSYCCNPFVTPEQFGARGDGVHDDAPALQAAIALAAAAGVPLLLRGVTYLVMRPLKFAGCYITMQGVPKETCIKAGAAMDYILDVSEPTEVASYSPISISGIWLHGNGLVQNANLYLQYRRQYRLEDILTTDVPTGRGIRIKDGNSGTLKRVVTSSVHIGLHCEGSNHQTLHESCAFNAASDVGVLVEAAGSLPDGNVALTFLNCLIQSGSGQGIRLQPKTQIDWIGGYIGEALDGACIENRGGIFKMRGGVLFFGHTTSNHAVLPLGTKIVDPTSGQSTIFGGTTIFDGTRLASQSDERGLQWLIGPAEPDFEAGYYGKVGFTDIDLYAVHSGGARWAGDVLLPMPSGAESLVPRNGRKWTAAGTAGFTPSDGTGAFADGKIVTNVNSLHYGFQVPVDTDWTVDHPLFAAIVYRSSKGLVLRVDTGFGAGNGWVLGVAPAAEEVSTFVAFEHLAGDMGGAGSAYVTLYTNGDGEAGDESMLLRAGIVSGRVFPPRSGASSFIGLP